MTELLFDGVVENGRVKLVDREYYEMTLREYEGKQITLVIRGRKRKRTVDQNSYYWGVVIDTIAREFGYDPNELHEALKEKFIGQEDPRTGLRFIKGSSKLGTREFGEYVDRIVVWAASEHGIIIPEADSFNEN